MYPNLIMQYKRAHAPGGTFFFTVVTYDRKTILCTDKNPGLLKKAFKYVMESRPFHIDAIVVLPDHLHCIWTLPEGDSNFSQRWMLIKRHFTLTCDDPERTPPGASHQHKREQTVWQRRFWEHRIRDERDYNRHVEYIHYNPVKHGLVKAPIDWPHTSFHRFVNKGIYHRDWGGAEPVVFDGSVGNE
jgi:putative transposase